MTTSVMISPSEAAARLKVSAGSVRFWASQGRIPGALRTPGGHYRLPADVTDALLAPVRASDDAPDSPRRLGAGS